jgi:oligoendopeptidase F
MNAPAWNIESEYASLDAPLFQADEKTVRENLQALAAQIKALDLAGAAPGPSVVRGVQEALKLDEATNVLLYNLSVWVSCSLSVNAAFDAARAKNSELQTLAAERAQALAPLEIFLQRCSEEVFAQVVADPALHGWEFALRQARNQAPYLLSPEQEILLKAMATPGHLSWGNLYQELTGKGKCELKLKAGNRMVGIAEAAALTYGPDPELREAGWKAVQAFWTEHRETAAAVVNSLASWRLEENKLRSHTKERHFLAAPLAMNRISEKTLEAVIGACRQNLPQLRRAITLMARTFGREKMHPWDLLSPSPITASPEPRSFEEGIRYVKDAFSKVDPEFGGFVEMMEKNRWIEARVIPNKGGGAYCTHFSKSLEPRVFQTYMGSLPDILTLAHELGHAYHTWTMRDLPRGQQDYPMTLAETASVFGENAVKDSLFQIAASREEKIEFAFADVESIAGYLINIPARFEFEKAFYEKRRERSLSADELSQLMDETWTRWYGTTLTQNDPLFWATKQHFSFAELSFYNFPYAFGYLFSLSIYARKEALGAKFMPTYRAILRDTGRLTAEELVQKHLKEDITQPSFWQKAIDVEIGKIDRFEALLK